MTPDPQVRQGGEAIRTWTLDWQSAPARVSGPKELEGDKYVEVIELEPVLDLLERCNAQQIVALLREHGRLP